MWVEVWIEAWGVMLWCFEGVGAERVDGSGCGCRREGVARCVRLLSRDVCRDREAYLCVGSRGWDARKELRKAERKRGIAFIFLPCAVL